MLGLPVVCSCATHDARPIAHLVENTHIQESHCVRLCSSQVDPLHNARVVSNQSCTPTADLSTHLPLSAHAPLPDWQA